MNPVFKAPGFRRLCLNAACNAVSVGGDYVLVGWLTLTVTQTSAWVGAAFALYYLPMVLLGVPAGSLADRFNRRLLIMGLEWTALLVVAGFAALTWYAGEPGLNIVLALTLALGSLRAVHHPVRMSFAYDLVGAQHVTAGLAGVSFATRIGMMGGAMCIGALVQKFSLAHALAFMATAHLVAGASLLGRFAGSPTHAADSSPIWQNLKDSARELKHNHVLLALTLVTASVEIFGTSYATALPELAERRLSLGAQGLGWMHAAQAAGGLVIGILIFVLPQRRHYITAYTASILCLGAGVIALGYAPSLVTTLMALALISGMITGWDIFTQSMMQLCVPDRLRGRAMGAWVFAIGSAPLGHLEIGVFAAAAGLDIALYANGYATIAVIMIAILLTPSLRRL